MGAGCGGRRGGVTMEGGGSSSGKSSFRFPVTDGN